MENNSYNSSGRVATIGGILTMLLFKANLDELLRNALLAVIGATISFGVSKFLNYILRRLRRK